MHARRSAFAAFAALALSFPGCDGCDDDDSSGSPPPPAAPSGLAVTLFTSGRIALGWTDNSPDETGFLVECSPDGTTWTPVATLPPDSTSFVHRGLLPLTTYFYRVSAAGNGGSAPAGPVSQATANLVWQAAAGGGPTARFEHSAVYDAANRRMVVYGGDDLIPDIPADTTYQNDVWALDFSTLVPTWSALAPGGAAAPYLASHSAVYDAANFRMIVFGGTTSTSMGSTIENAVWELMLPDDGITAPAWTLLAPTPDPVDGTPAPRFNHSAVYDSANLRMIVFGGIDGTNSFADAWALSLPVGGGSPAWTRLADGPQDLHGHSAVYDATGLRMIVFGGNSLTTSTDSNAVHVLDLPAGALAPSWSTPVPASASPPDPRFEHAAVYDPANERMVVFGGQAFFAPVDETWLLPLQGALAFTAAAPGGTPTPVARISHTAVYDPNFERMVVFSGDDGSFFPVDDAAWPLGF